MIRFTCQCGHRFVEPDDSAGLFVPCPKCTFLCEIPAQPLPIDTYADDVENQDQAGGEPRYDPQTGELIPAIELAESRPPMSHSRPIPFAEPALGYETFGAIGGRTMAGALLELVQPLNVLVMAFVLILHCFAFFTIAGMALGLFIIAPLFIVVMMVILAHYANVIDEIGIVEQDELPRVMRDLQLHEDIWWPFVRVVTALALSYGPAVAALFLPIRSSTASSFATVFALVGTFLFPAVILTLQTSGSLANLRPDRVLGVIRVTGMRYIIGVFTFLIAFALYVYSVASILAAELELSPYLPHFSVPGGKITLAAAMLCGAILVMHLFCWELGLLYRNDNMRFPWVNRIHVRENRPKVARRKPKYLTSP